MLTIDCLPLSIAHVQNKGKTQKVSKGLSLRKIYTNVHTILPTDAFKLQISAQRRRLALCW